MDNEELGHDELGMPVSQESQETPDRVISRDLYCALGSLFQRNTDSSISADIGEERGALIPHGRLRWAPRWFAHSFHFPTPLA